MIDLARQLDRARLPARGAYLLILLMATLPSLDFAAGGAVDPDRLARMFSPSVSARDAIDGARNLALFAGWGLVWMLTARPGRTLVALGFAVLTGAAVSLSVETAQLLSTSRTPSVLDLFTNTAGALGGALILVMIVMAAARRREGRSYVGMPATVFAWAYGVAAFAEAFVPLFRQDAFPNAFRGPFGRFRTTAEMFEWSSLTDLPVTDLLLYVPAGAFAVAALAEGGRSYGSAAIRVGVVGTLLSILAEVSHGFLGLPIEAGAVLAHASGIVIGAAATVYGLPRLTRRLRGPARPRALLVAYGTLLMLWALRPYLPELSLVAIGEKLVGDWWIPLGLLAQRVDMFSVVDVVTPFLLYLPLGGLLAVWPVASSGPLRLFWPALYLAATTEVCQLLVLGRTLDVTDLLVQASGALVGWTVLRRAGFRPYGFLRRAHPAPSRGRR